MIFSTCSKNPRHFCRKGESGSLMELASIPNAQDAMVSMVILCQSLEIIHCKISSNLRDYFDFLKNWINVIFISIILHTDKARNCANWVKSVSDNITWNYLPNWDDVNPRFVWKYVTFVQLDVLVHEIRSYIFMYTWCNDWWWKLSKRPWFKSYFCR